MLSRISNLTSSLFVSLPLTLDHPLVIMFREIERWISGTHSSQTSPTVLYPDILRYFSFLFSVFLNQSFKRLCLCVSGGQRRSLLEGSEVAGGMALPIYFICCIFNRSLVLCKASTSNDLASVDPSRLLMGSELKFCTALSLGLNTAKFFIYHLLCIRLVVLSNRVG